MESCCHCEKPVYCRQMCKAHYQRWWRTGDVETDGTVTYTRVRDGKEQTVTRRVRSGEMGYGRTPLYRAWTAMLRRCEDPKAHNYRWYGDRGITVCQSWHDFFVFREWAMKNGYERGMELDRRDPTRGYSPRNCRYVPKQVNLARRGRGLTVVLSKQVHRSVDDIAAERGVRLDDLVEQIVSEWVARESAPSVRSTVRR